MIFRFMVDQLQNHSGLFKKVPPISLYPQQIPGCRRKRQHEARIVPGSVPGVRLCGEFLKTGGFEPFAGRLCER